MKQGLADDVRLKYLCVALLAFSRALLPRTGMTTQVQGATKLAMN
jgi:hypothetical protein